MKHGPRIFFESGTSGKQLPWSYDETLFERWRDGKTGMPLVDANMREIKQTGKSLCSFQQVHLRHFHATLRTEDFYLRVWCAGFMSNRGRQNVASYLALDLGIDWRKVSLPHASC